LIDNSVEICTCRGSKCIRARSERGNQLGIRQREQRAHFPPASVVAEMPGVLAVRSAADRHGTPLSLRQQTRVAA